MSGEKWCKVEESRAIWGCRKSGGAGKKFEKMAK